MGGLARQEPFEVVGHRGNSGRWIAGPVPDGEKVAGMVDLRERERRSRSPLGVVQQVLQIRNRPSQLVDYRLLVGRKLPVKFRFDRGGLGQDDAGLLMFAVERNMARAPFGKRFGRWAPHRGEFIVERPPSRREAIGDGCDQIGPAPEVGVERRPAYAGLFQHILDRGVGVALPSEDSDRRSQQSVACVRALRALTSVAADGTIYIA